MKVNAKQLISASLLEVFTYCTNWSQLNKSAQSAQRDSVVVTGPQLHRIHLKISLVYLETLKAVLATFSIRFSEVSEEKFCPIPK